MPYNPSVQTLKFETASSSTFVILFAFQDRLLILFPGIVVIPLPPEIRITTVRVTTALYPSKEPGGTRIVTTPI